VILMNDTVILFEDESFRLLLPLVYTRPAFELRCGIFTLRERVAAVTGEEPRAICRPHLANVYGAGRWPLSLLSRSTPITLINGRALDLDWLPELLAGPVNTMLVADAGRGPRTTLLGARLTPALASAILLYLINQESGLALNELRRFTKVRELSTRMLAFPWDIINENGSQIIHDLELHQRQYSWPTAAQHALNIPWRGAE
jgi:UDP-N-acetylglucosamine diphosphorylase / glucose-1-phosphate thymidylyltransferase / UDP-N-acetylgalactosamine diphosphorylase / glucosamine-1-phosphate N-acetyltransferase / galactosamine-1-phosphate N-acetyltransferase